MSITKDSDSPATPPPARSLPIGLAEHPDYEILRELGRGGMGVVYLAYNKLMGRKEVLKVVSHELTARRGVLDRFLREIRNAAQLHHANIVTAYSAIRAGESIAFAMEYVEGYDLSQLVKGQGPLAVSHACNFLLPGGAGATVRASERNGAPRYQAEQPDPRAKGRSRLSKCLTSVWPRRPAKAPSMAT